MDTTKHIQTLAKVQLVSLVVIIAVSFFFEDTLPPLLQEYTQQQADRELSGVEMLAIWPLMAVGLVSIVSLFAMIQLKPWSKPAYIYSLLAGYILILPLGPAVSAPVSYFLESLATLLSGMLVALLYFTSSVFTPGHQAEVQERVTT